jgi:hypothetical protein
MERSQKDSKETRSLVQTQTQTQRDSQFNTNNYISNIINVEKPLFITRDIYDSDVRKI